MRSTLPGAPARPAVPVDPPPGRPPLPREGQATRRLADQMRARGIPARVRRWVLQFCYALAMAAATAMVCIGLQLPLPVTLAAFVLALVAAAAIIRACDPD